MFRQALKYVAGLIGLYLVVVYASGFGQDINAGASGGSLLVKTFQGRG